MALAPSTRIGNYEILAPLGAGGMGEVYRARDTRLDRQVAIKTLRKEFQSDRDRLDRFEREAKLLAPQHRRHLRSRRRPGRVSPGAGAGGRRDACGAAPPRASVGTGDDRGRRPDRCWLHELDEVPALGSHAAMIASETSLRLGEPELALHFLERRTVRPLTPTVVRLDPNLHSLLDRPPFAPRRRPVSLVWPLEASKIDAARHAIFREVRIESGIPQGSDLLGPAPA